MDKKHPIQYDPEIHEFVRIYVKDILAGKRRAGSYLPPIPELAKKHEMSRSKTRNALGKLEELGLIEIKPGRKPRVLDYAFCGHLALVNRLFQCNQDHGLKHMLLIEMERILDESIHAASQLNAETLTSAKDVLESMLNGAPIEHRELLIFKYYRTLTDAAGRPLLLWTLNELAPTFLRGFEALTNSDERYHGTIRLLTTQLHHIVQGNLDKALAVQTSLFQHMSDHIRTM